MSVQSEALEAIDLAIANGAIITDILGISFPNGPTADGTCRDIALPDLDVEQSAKVLKAIRAVLAGPEE